MRVNGFPLYHVWDYTPLDRAFWDEHLEGWVPRRLVDAHMHLSNPDCRLRPMTEERRRQFWVAEVTGPIRADEADRCQRLVYPGRELTCIALGSPYLDFDIEANNEYLRTECLRYGWHALPVIRPQWTAGVVSERPQSRVPGRRCTA